MRTLVAVLLTFTAVVVFVMKLALEKEYQWWAPRVGAVLIRCGSRMMPKKTRESRRQEWLAELDLLEQSGMHGLMFAMRILVRSPIAGVADRRVADHRVNEPTTRTVRVQGDGYIIHERAGGDETVVFIDEVRHGQVVRSMADAARIKFTLREGRSFRRPE